MMPNCSEISDKLLPRPLSPPACDNNKSPPPEFLTHFTIWVISFAVILEKSGHTKTNIS